MKKIILLLILLVIIFLTTKIDAQPQFFKVRIENSNIFHSHKVVFLTHL